jgi:hypothetical protein
MQAEKEKKPESSSEADMVSETIDGITARLFQTACNFLELEQLPKYQQIAGDNRKFILLKSFNSEIDEVFYLYLDLQTKEVFLIPLYGDATLKSANPSEIVFNVEGYSRTEGKTRFPYKFTCVKIANTEYDFWGGFYGISDNYWVKTYIETRFGTVYDFINLAQIVATTNSVQFLFNLPMSATGAPPLQEITFDSEAGICKIRIFNCKVMPKCNIYVPNQSCIRDIQYKEDGVDCIITISYDASAVDVYTVESSTDKNYMPVVELKLGSSTEVSNVLESR